MRDYEQVAQVVVEPQIILEAVMLLAVFLEQFLDELFRLLRCRTGKVE